MYPHREAPMRSRELSGASLAGAARAAASRSLGPSRGCVQRRRRAASLRGAWRGRRLGLTFASDENERDLQRGPCELDGGGDEEGGRVRVPVGEVAAESR